MSALYDLSFPSWASSPFDLISIRFLEEIRKERRRNKERNKEFKTFRLPPILKPLVPPISGSFLSHRNFPANVMRGISRRQRTARRTREERPPADRPHFFKILLSNFFEKLPIPMKFIRKFGKELSDAIVLKGPTGREWHMKLKEVDGAVCFIDGWKEFTEYHSLCIGYFLVFRYDGCSQFNVQVFDISACEKEYPITSEKSEPPNSYGKAAYTPGEESDDSIQILSVSMAKGRNLDPTESGDCQQGLRSRLRSCIRSNAINMKSNCETKPKDYDKDKKISLTSDNQCKEELDIPCSSSKHIEFSQHQGEDVKLANGGVSDLMAEEVQKTLLEAQKSKSNNPFFIVVMKPSHVHNHHRHLHIPVNFVRNHLQSQPQRFILEHSNGRKWHIVCRYRRNDAYLNGWGRFVADVNIKEGDVCIFELIKKRKRFRVIIYRVDEVVSLDKMSAKMIPKKQRC